MSASVASLTTRLGAAVEAVKPYLKPITRHYLLFGTVVTAAQSLVPSLRMPAALANRSLSLCCTTLQDTKPGLTERLLKIGKAAVIILGIVALVAKRPVLYVASLASDLGIEAIKSTRAAQEGDFVKCCIHASVVVVDALFLTAIAAKSGGFLAAAALVSVCTMGAFSVYAASKGDVSDAVCYGLLALIAGWAATAPLEFTRQQKTDSHFTVHNTTEDRMVFYDKTGKITTANPGETVDFTVPYKHTFHHVKYQPMVLNGVDSYCSVIYYPRHYGSYVNAAYLSSEGDLTQFKPYNALFTDKETIVVKAPLNPQEYPTLPLGGNAVVVPCV